VPFPRFTRSSRFHRDRHPTTSSLGSLRSTTELRPLLISRHSPSADLPFLYFRSCLAYS